MAAALFAFPAGAVEIQGAEVVSNPGADKTYATGDAIEVAVSFDGPVYVTHSPSLTFTITFTFQVGPQQQSEQREMRFVDGGGTRRLLFRYRVQEDDQDTNGISFGTGAINGGTLTDGQGVDVPNALPEALSDDENHMVDAVAPEATAVTIVSDPGDDGIYAARDHIDLEVSFDEEIVVSGAPEILISIGSLSRIAELFEVRPARLSFRYVVQSGDLDSDGISVQADALQGGTIVD
ncbi:MAG: hypothetical protein F4X99_14245, partial [Gammaproteobacteria bacterium]|nr:hypothetical protein [Gammaproteobacteria bacterium]